MTVVATGHHRFSGRAWIRAEGDARIEAFGEVVVEASENVVLYAHDRCIGILRDHAAGDFYDFSHAFAADRSHAYGEDRATVEAFGSASVGGCDHVHVLGRGSSRAVLRGHAVGHFCETAQAETHDYVRASGRGNSYLQAHDESIGVLHEFATGVCADGAQLIDLTEPDSEGGCAVTPGARVRTRTGTQMKETQTWI